VTRAAIVVVRNPSTGSLAEACVFEGGDGVDVTGSIALGAPGMTSYSERDDSRNASTPKALDRSPPLSRISSLPLG
jgi:hypothetical protein